MKRFPVMYNDFVLIGPAADPAGIAGGKDTLDALRKIKNAGAPFVSRGDRSGTHIAEIDLWKMASVDIGHRKRVRGTARQARAWGRRSTPPRRCCAYILADRGTWLAFKNRGDLTILVEGDKRLMNQYGVMLVNPATHPTVKREDGQAFIDWIISPDGQNAIAEYQIGGEQLFFPNADQPGA